MILHKWSFKFFSLRETFDLLFLCSNVFKFNEKRSVSWKISSLLSLNFLFLTIFLDTVFICIERCCEDKLFWDPHRIQKLKVNMHTARARNTVFYEACSLQFFILLKLEERVCGEK